MVTYRRRKRTHALLVGLLVFAVAMMITFADVYGMNRFDYRVPGTTPPSNTVTPTTDAFDCPTSIGDDQDPVLRTSNTAIPEPTTMVLMGLGLSALWFRKRKN